MPDPVTTVPLRPVLEARLPCPVCLGVQMDKVVVDDGRLTLTLDHCTRCGGVWFEKGEAQQLARFSPSDLWRHIPPRQTAPMPPCHGCHAPLDRDAEQCPACGTKNELRCPACDKTMERREHGGLTLDVCASCKGVWFDHIELRSVWSLAIAALGRKRPGRGAEALAVGGDVLLESLFWAPGLTLYTGAAIAHGVGSAASALGNVSVDGAASAAMGAAEAVGGAAEGVFSAIMDIISSIFD
ncbi:MAG: zf-TFIIB domain-containing protein [Gemmatimonadota bacterium]